MSNIYEHLFAEILQITTPVFAMVDDALSLDIRLLISIR